ncbi:MAG: glycosyltransferase [Magnetococcus sp. YQC-5]
MSMRFFETVFHLDAMNDTAGLIRFVTNGSYGPETISDAILLLLVRSRMHSASVLARLLVSNGYRDPFTAIAQALGGVLHDIPQEKSEGMRDLAAMVDALSVDQQGLLYYPIIYSTVLPWLTELFQNVEPGVNERVLRILEVMQAAVPSWRRIFAWDATVPTWSLEELRQRGREQARLISYPLPPEDVPRQPRRVVVAMISNVHNVAYTTGARVVAALNAYGWQTKWDVDRCGIEAYPAIVEQCRQHNAELLIMELEQVCSIRACQERMEMIAQLRQENPSFKVVGILYDAWGRAQDLLRADASVCDLLWCLESPSRPLWQEPLFANKMLHIALPTAGNVGRPDRPLIPRMLFASGITGWNYPRLFWMAAAKRLGLPIDNQRATYQPDGLSALENFSRYMQRHAEATCCINFTMRMNLVCNMTDRSFWTPLSGALLVQEASPEMHHYFIPGEHYLEFSTLAELSAVARFITENQDAAEEIRRCGNAFAYEHYRDEKLIGYIDKALYF